MSEKSRISRLETDRCVPVFWPYCQPSDFSPITVMMSPSLNVSWLSTSAVNEYRAWTCPGGWGAAVRGGKVFAGIIARYDFLTLTSGFIFYFMCTTLCHNEGRVNTHQEYRKENKTRETFTSKSLWSWWFIHCLLVNVLVYMSLSHALHRLFRKYFLNKNGTVLTIRNLLTINKIAAK